MDDNPEEKDPDQYEMQELIFDKDEDEEDTIDVESIPIIAQLKQDQSLDKPTMLDYIERYQKKLILMNTTKEELKTKVQKLRSGSIIDVHNRMFKKLMEQEQDLRGDLHKKADEIVELETTIKRQKISENQAIHDEQGTLQQYNDEELQKALDIETDLRKQIAKLKADNKEMSDQLSIKKMEKKEHDKNHRKSISALHTSMFKKLLDAEDQYEAKIDDLKADLQDKEHKIEKAKMEDEHKERSRRESINTIHSSMMQKVLNAQNELTEKQDEWNKEKKDLLHEIKILKLEKNVRQEKNNENNNNEEDNMSDLEGDDDDADDQKEKESNNKMGDEKFNSLWKDADDTGSDNETIARLKKEIEELTAELDDTKKENVQIEKSRKDSIHNLHNNMFQKLLDAEFEYEEEIERLHREKEDLQEKVQYYEDSMAKMQGDGSGSASSSDDGVANPMEILKLRQSMKEKEMVIEENKNQIFELVQQIGELEEKVKEEEKERRGSVHFLSNKMMSQLLESEEQSELIKQGYERRIEELEKQLKQQSNNANELDKTRRNSLTAMSQGMFKKVLDEQAKNKEMQQKYEKRIKDLEQELAIEKLKKTTENSVKELHGIEQNNQYESKVKKLEDQITQINLDHEVQERERKMSFSQLKNKMWSTLLDAEDDYETQIKKLKNEMIKMEGTKDDLVRELSGLKKENEVLTAGKLNMLTEFNNQMNDLRMAVRIYNTNANGNSWFG